MTRDQARKILPLVNDPTSYALLKEYALDRIETLRTFLENQKDFNKVLETQGAIAELRRIATLRDEAIARSKDEQPTSR